MKWINPISKQRITVYLSRSIPLLFLILASAYSLVNPAWEAPDEVGHYIYAAQVAATLTLPVQRITELGEAHQPPLYYLIAALAMMPTNLNDPTGAFNPNPAFMWAGKGGHDRNVSLHPSVETFPFQGQALALHLARAISVLMSTLTVALVIRMAQSVFPDRPPIYLLAGALVAFNPQFLFISGSINNDNLLTLAMTGGWWQLLQTLQRPAAWRSWLSVGLWLALALLTKLSGLTLGVVAGIMLARVAWQQRSARLFICGTLALSVPVVLLTGWWFARNQILYGDPVGWTMYAQVFAVNLRSSQVQWQDLNDLFNWQFHSFWGMFGWMNVPSPDWLYTITLGLCALALIGILRFIARLRGGLFNFQKASLALLAFALVVQEGYLIALIQQCNATCYQGRYLFPIIGPLAVLMSLGLLNLLPKRMQPLLTSSLILGLLGVAVIIPFQVITPAYHLAPQPKWTLWFVPHKTDFTFGRMFALKGYELNQSTDHTQLTLILHWQALQTPDFNYSAFVHLIDDSNQIIAQKDHAPGENLRYPPIIWLPGDIIRDEHIIKVSELKTTSTYRLRVGVYQWMTGAQLPAEQNGASVGSFIILDQPVKY